MKRNVFSVPMFVMVLAIMALVASGGCGGSDHDSIDGGNKPISNNTGGGRTT